MQNELNLRQSARYREILPTAAEAAAAFKRMGDAARVAGQVPPRPCKFTEFNGIGRCTHCGIEAKPTADSGTSPLEFIAMVAQEDCEAYRRAEAFAASRMRADTAASAREATGGLRRKDKSDAWMWGGIFVLALLLLAFAAGGTFNVAR